MGLARVFHFCAILRELAVVQAICLDVLFSCNHCASPLLVTIIISCFMEKVTKAYRNKKFFKKAEITWLINGGPGISFVAQIFLGHLLCARLCPGH